MNKNKNRGCLSGILGTIIVIIGVIIYAILASLISNILISTRFEDGAHCALLSLSIIGITVAFVLYEAIFIAREIKNGSKGTESEKKTDRIFRIVLVLGICLSLVFALVSANTFTELSDDSISMVFFKEYKNYRWDDRCDILKYSLSCDANGNLAYNVFMKDGEVVEIFGQVNSCSDEFIEKYDNLYGYAAYLTEQFRDSEYIIDEQISGVEHMEKLYKNGHPEIWEHLDKIINGGDSDG